MTVAGPTNPTGAPALPVLDDGQRAVVGTVVGRGGCLLVTGGPGTGKTTALVAAVAGLVGQGVPLAEIVVLAQARPAAQRLRRQIMAAVGVTQAAPRITTVHGWCRALLDRYGEPGPVPPRLLSAPEQEYRVRELLAAETGVEWPAELGEAAHSPAFAGQLRALLARARQLGFDPAGLAAAGLSAGRPEWVAAARFFALYLDVNDAEGVLDYAELVHRSRVLMSEDEVRAGVAAHTQAVLMDDFAECDESVVALLRDIWRAGVPVTVFGDETTQVFGFRGAWPAALKRFPAEFAGVAGPAPVITLEHRWRVAGQAEAWAADTPGDEAALLGERLWQAHSQGVAWDEMAVIGRASGAALARLARGLAQAGVPVRLEGETLALAESPAVRVLLAGLDLVVAEAAGVATTRQWLDVWCSPLVGLDEVDLRRLGRRLGLSQVPEGADGWAGGLLAAVRQAAVGDDVVAGRAVPKDVAVLWRRLVAATVRLRELAGQVADGSASQLAWGVWQLGDWPEQLRRASLGRAEGALRADRDLDAVIAFFDLAQAHPQWRGADGVAGLAGLVGEQVVQRDRAREAEDPPGVVTVLSAYRAKGRGWPVVALTGAAEGVWPPRGAVASLLEPERLCEDGQLPATTRGEEVAAERRLFTLAASRAACRLIVTCAPPGDDEPLQPSRFLAGLGLTAQPWQRGGAAVASSWPLLVGELRAAAMAPDEAPGLVAAAVTELRQLRTARRADGQPLAAAADPGGWWWAGGLTAGQRPLAEPGQPVHLSASGVGLALACPRAWFLQRQAGGSPARGAAAGFGLVAHWLFQAYAVAAPAPPQLEAALDQAWAALPYRAAWQALAQREELEAALARFLAWRDGRPGRRLLGTEVDFSQVWETPGGPVEVTGRVDRLELDADGRLVVVDFKTASHPDIKAHTDQLGIYQLAVQRGAFDDLAPGLRQAAPPELVWPRIGPRRADTGCRVDQAKIPDPAEWVPGHLAQAAAVVRAERFDATPGAACRSCAFWGGCPAATLGVDDD